ncbi:MAG: hypothetical protein F4205_15395 [Gemmatimonadetes bacterium]|nr:hypothetical protein [Gemmatimonadota bacterium]MYC90589.1 hypothetical protein [Gemmatimonadota bacterium]MYG36865.1 hypothetical protein [Gemmatimonadota bacterium]
MAPITLPTYQEALDRILGCAVLIHGAENLEDLSEIDFGTLVEESGFSEHARSIKFIEAAGALRSEIQMGAEFARVLESLDPRRQVIARRRTYSWRPAKLAALGNEFGVSRERARQLEVRLRETVDEQVSELVGEAARWLRRAIGLAASPEKFRSVLDLMIGDAHREWRAAAEVAVMREAGYEYLDGVVGGKLYRDQVAEARRRAPGLANVAGVVDEDALRQEIGAETTPEWEAVARNAGLVRFAGSLVIRDTRRARVYLALDQRGEPLRREDIAAAAQLKDTSSLSSLLSSDPLFVRFTKDKWGLAHWTDEPYVGVVEALVKRIEEGGGAAPVDELVREIPKRFDVLPATVRNYLSTRKFAIDGNEVRIVAEPVAPLQSLSEARDVVWTHDGNPALRFIVGEHHLRGNSQKVSGAVAQYLGVGLDQSTKIPFSRPSGVDEASVIWRSYDPNGPEVGRLREALFECGAAIGEDVFIVLDRDGLRMLTDGAEMTDEKPQG